MTPMPVLLNYFLLNLSVKLYGIKIFIKSWSQETERESGNTGRLHRNLFGTLKFIEQPKTPGINIKKHGKL